MYSKIGLAISMYQKNNTKNNLELLELTFLNEEFLIPLRYDAKEMSESKFDIPAICIRKANGLGTMPIFTNIDQLLKWKPSGAKYIVMDGKTIVKMALEMIEVNELSINISGLPRGTIPRSEFARLSEIE